MLGTLQKWLTNHPFKEDPNVTLRNLDISNDRDPYRHSFSPADAGNLQWPAVVRGIEPTFSISQWIVTGRDKVVIKSCGELVDEVVAAREFDGLSSVLLEQSNHRGADINLCFTALQFVLVLVKSLGNIDGSIVVEDIDGTNRGGLFVNNGGSGTLY
ncbi:hypothetical protein DFH08DRAFT_1027277 [Mycena albidolilacea]|uniref:Uncharacterized protein n=1 Tax=Mycena albidolilacea TaxID=1033008 RepID=A0AAD6ZKJ5_9AGAR|nr:hypothetical protein DFH08DRAFT_1027277 [Mycena albidolilacea]